MADLSPKTQSVSIIITGIVGSLISVLFLGIAKPVLASDDISFVCGEYKGEPVTFLVTPTVKKPIIVWDSKFFEQSGYPPEVCCSMITYNLNKSYAKGSEPILTTGFMGKPDDLYPVICTTDKKGGDCQELLYTLKKGIQDPDETLAKLVNIQIVPNQAEADMDKSLLRESKCNPNLYVSIKKNGDVRGKYACKGETGILNQVWYKFLSGVNSLIEQHF